VGNGWGTFFISHMIYFHQVSQFLWGNVEMSISKDQIREWKKEGWKFRVKKVKGIKYISRRKGKEERGLGRYSDELWRLIQNTRIEPSEFEQRREAEILVEDLLKTVREYHMSVNCYHIVEGFCHFWRYDEKPGFFNIVDDRIGEGYYKKIVTGESSTFWVFKAVRFYCSNCLAFREE